MTWSPFLGYRSVSKVFDLTLWEKVPTTSLEPAASQTA
eukprot:CAMPEP_0194675576 /NCGR_PEP_ID=MMETSP0295-20121207/8351_1 /TAXON_ID=39354 /ORGANISM="Heterosigma akashiwo, Strain CCMP2393" /LENGTH=37 /DNA_ID= /DNA_START= /DNA_END= /DNA_ORIENTATION=